MSDLKLRIYGTIGAVLGAATIAWLSHIEAWAKGWLDNKINPPAAQCMPWKERCPTRAIAIRATRLVPGFAAVCRESLLAGTRVVIFNQEGRNGFLVKVGLHTSCSPSELKDDEIRLHPEDMRKILQPVTLDTKEEVSIHVLRDPTTDMAS